MNQIMCPHCGYAGDGVTTDGHGETGHEASDGLRLLEDITVYRFVKGLRDGRLVVNEVYHTGEGYDEGIEGTFRLECRRCLQGFTVPVDIDIEWE